MRSSSLFGGVEGPKGPTRGSAGLIRFPNYGTDLNRNCGFKWGLGGSSALPCNETYRGPSAVSEPENQAIRDYIRLLFPDQRGPNDTDAAPTNATGLAVSLHSYSQLVLYPWGWTYTLAPNSAALQTLGGRFAYFNHYTVEPITSLYVASGGLDDWVYGELGVAAYTIEMGTAFFESCTTFQNTTYPANRLALLYACKACRQPYLDPAGPDVLQVTVSPPTNGFGAPISLEALAVSGRTYGYSPLPATPNITAARYSVDNPSWVAGAVTHAMSAADGSFNSSNELISATIDTFGWSPGRHTVFVEARTGAGDWGVPTAVFANVEPMTITASLRPGAILLQWPSVSGKLYTLLQSSNLSLPFSVLASNLPAQPPGNTYTDAVSTTGSRFYRLRVEP